MLFILQLTYTACGKIYDYFSVFMQYYITILTILTTHDFEDWPYAVNAHKETAAENVRATPW